MPSSFSIKLGDFLYKNAFPVYNIIYPFLKEDRITGHSLMQQHIKKAICLDIGANLVFILKYSDLVGETGKVMPEPIKPIFTFKKTLRIDECRIHNKAVSDKTGKLRYKSELLNVITNLRN